MPAATFIADPTALAGWAASLSAQIQACGLVKTADTGQINMAGPPAMGAAHTSYGYEIYRFADALQATSPVFMKIEYGSGGQNGARPGLWITFGTGSDGAGNLTGRVSTRIPLSAYEASNTAGSNKCYVSGDTGRLCFSLFNNTDTRYGLLFSVERTCDAAGNLTGDGLMIIAKAHFSPGWTINEVAWDIVWWNYTFILPPGHASVAGRPALSGTNWCFYPGYNVGNGGTLAYGADLAMLPIVMPSMRGLENPGKNLFGHMYTQIALDSQFTLPVYGVNRNYISLSYGSWWQSGNGWGTAMAQGFDEGMDVSAASWRNQHLHAMAAPSNPPSLAMRWD